MIMFFHRFLDYMNKGLELFENDPDVAFISGYRKPVHESDEPNNVAAYYNFSSWGTDGWFHKQDSIISEINRVLTCIIKDQIC